TGVGDRASRTAVPPGDELEQARDGDGSSGAPREEVGDRDGARDGLETATVPAAADQASFIDEHMADLARYAAVAAVRPAVEDEPRSDAGRDAHVEQV